MIRAYTDMANGAYTEVVICFAINAFESLPSLFRKA